QKKGKFLGLNRDNDILLPMGALQKRDSRINFLVADFTPISPQRMEDAIEQVRAELRRQRRLRYFARDTFAMFSQDTLTNLYRSFTGGIYLVMIAISSIGLLVGGGGVMNIMLVSVTERTREIGLRLAVGARRRDIRNQFLTEAVTLCVLGGLIGLVVGTGAAWAVAKLAGWPIFLGTDAILFAVFFAASIGIFFGYYPARKAARLEPVEALRSE
ncbi:MAG: ABC transporter permease, partial [Microvirga sp.]